MGDPVTSPTPPPATPPPATPPATPPVTPPAVPPSSALAEGAKDTPPPAVPPATPPGTPPGAPPASALEAGATGEASAGAQTPEQKAAADAAAAAAVAANVATYKELKPPEGMKLDTPTWQAVAPILAKAGVKLEDAQALVNEFAKAESARVAAETASYVTAQKAAQAKCAELFKPEDYKAAARAINTTFKDAGLVQFMMQQLGNHPDFIAGMAKFGRAMADDSTPGTRQGGGAETPDAAQQFSNAAGWTKK